MEEPSNIFTLTKDDTKVMKGIAIIAMLFHHLYYCAPTWAAPHPLVLEWLGDLGKVCVAIFLFCSGYGLAVGYSRLIEDCRLQITECRLKVLVKETLKFLAKRFVKFYAGYWPIFLIFVPISVYFFGRPLSAAYGESVNILKRLVYDMLGVQGYQSYNMTWWFNKLIIFFYLLFPLLYMICKRFPWFSLVIAFVAMFYDGVSWDYLSETLSYGFPFVLGIVWRMKESAISHKLAMSNNRHILLVSFALLIAVLVGLRFYIDFLHLPLLSGGRIDGLITCALCGLIVALRPYHTGLKSFLAYCGGHSMNVYLMHSFFVFYWPTSCWLHSARISGGGNFIIVFAVCFSISIAIEWLKEKSKYNKLVNNIWQER